jgi:fructose-bisphosphate aldolase class I
MRSIDMTTYNRELDSIARQLVAPGRGILAADESSGTIKKRFDSIALESTEENRRAYRDLLFTAPGVEEFLSGVILYDETLRQKASDGRPFAQVLEQRGILPGIKVDAGAKALALAPEEKITEGLDGLRERCAEYRKLGARFTKWRAVIDVDEKSGIPSDLAIDANAHALARYAAIAIEQDLVPIVEPEVLMDGGHSLETCFSATERTLRAVFAELARQRVPFEAMLLKPNMVIPGKKHSRQASPQQVAEATVRCFRRTVPAAVPGIVFLSGGQSEEEATANLDAMNRLGTLAWQLSFSYGRALQASALAAWKGKAANVAAAQRAFHHRARLTSAARDGRYETKMEKIAV